MALIQNPATSFSPNGRGSRDLPVTGHGLGLYQLRNGWFGYGGPAPGLQTLMRYNPTLRVGYVIMVNVNALHGGGAEDMTSVREEVYRIQNELLAVLESGESQPLP